MHPYQEAIRSLAIRLHLPPASPYTQDWEAEVANAKAIPTYQALYESGILPELEKKALMRLILESLEQAAKSSIILPDELLKELSSLIQTDYKLHYDTLLLWALPDDLRDAELHLYRITPFVRKIIETH